MQPRTVDPWDEAVTRDRCDISIYGHIRKIIGTPVDAMTWYQCQNCGITWERGRGAFYEERTAPNTRVEQ